MSFGPRRRPVAAGETAPAVASRHADPLSRREEALRTAHVDHLAIRVESDRQYSRLARVPLDGVQRYAVSASLDAAGTFAPGQRLAAHVHPNGRRTGSEDRTVIRTCRHRDHLDERVMDELIIR